MRVALIPAAGAGLRMGGLRKQFRLLEGKPLLYHTVSVFLRHPDIDRVVVALPPESLEEVASWLEHPKVHRVAGGATRQASVYRALMEVPETAEVVLVHDAVRPFLRQEDVTAVLEAIARHGAAALAVPVVDTLRRGLDGRFGETVPREGLYRMQTPQGARYAWMKEAFVRAQEGGYRATDEVALLQRAGFPVVRVPGTPFNLKITTPEDWAFAEAFWPCWKAWSAS